MFYFVNNTDGFVDSKMHMYYMYCTALLNKTMIHTFGIFSL